MDLFRESAELTPQRVPVLRRQVDNKEHLNFTITKMTAFFLNTPLLCVNVMQTSLSGFT